MYFTQINIVDVFVWLMKRFNGGVLWGEGGGLWKILFNKSKMFWMTPTTYDVK